MVRSLAGCLYAVTIKSISHLEGFGAQLKTELRFIPQRIWRAINHSEKIIRCRNVWSANRFRCDGHRPGCSHLLRCAVRLLIQRIYAILPNLEWPINNVNTWHDIPCYIDPAMGPDGIYPSIHWNLSKRSNTKTLNSEEFTQKLETKCKYSNYVCNVLKLLNFCRKHLYANWEADNSIAVVACWC